MSTCYRWDAGDLVLSLRVQPKASRDGFGEVLGQELKVHITAPPVDGKANSHLTRFLAKAFGVARSAVVLEAGETSRSKRIRIQKPRRLPKIASHSLNLDFPFASL